MVFCQRLIQKMISQGQDRDGEVSLQGKLVKGQV